MVCEVCKQFNYSQNFDKILPLITWDNNLQYCHQCFYKEIFLHLPGPYQTVFSDRLKI
jgi:hypothetical protein